MGGVTVDPNLPPGGTNGSTIALADIDGTPGGLGLCGINASVVGFTTTNFPVTPMAITDLACVRGTVRIAGTNITDIRFTGAVDYPDANCDPFLGSCMMVGGDVVVDSNGGLVSVRFLTLDRTGTIGDVTSDLVIQKNPSLADVDFARLAATQGDLMIIDNDALPDLGGLGGADPMFPFLTEVHDDLHIIGNDVFDLPPAGTGLQLIDSVGGDVQISSNPMLTRVDFSTLDSATSLGGFGVTFEGNPSLVEVDLHELDVLGGSLRIASNDGMADLGHAMSLADVQGDLTITDNANLSSLDDLASITTVGGDLILDRLPALATMSGIGGITTVGGMIKIYAVAIATAGLPLLTSAYRLEMRDNDFMTAVDFPSLQTLTTELRLQGHIQLQAIGGASTGFPALQSVGTQIYMHDNDYLGSVTLPSLDEVGWRVWLKYNTPLSSWTAPCFMSKAPDDVVAYANTGVCPDLADWTALGCNGGVPLTCN